MAGSAPLGRALAVACRQAPHGCPCCPVLGCDGVERLGQAAQARAGGGEVLHTAHHVGHGPTKAVQPRNDQDVTRAQAREQAAECGLPAAVLRTGLLRHDLLAACLGQRPALRAIIGVTTATGPVITDQHGAASPGTAGFRPVPRRRTAGQGRAPRLSSAPMPGCPRHGADADGMRFPCISLNCETLIDITLFQCHLPCIKPSITVVFRKIAA